MTLHPTRISTDTFITVVADAYRPGEKILAADASDLDCRGLRPSRVYDDACDVGYTLVSHRTGREVVVVLSHVERDRREGETLWHDFRPVPGQLRADEPEFTVRLFND